MENLCDSKVDLELVANLLQIEGSVHRVGLGHRSLLTHRENGLRGRQEKLEDELAAPIDRAEPASRPRVVTAHRQCLDKFRSDWEKRIDETVRELQVPSSGQQANEFIHYTARTET